VSSMCLLMALFLHFWQTEILDLSMHGEPVHSCVLVFGLQSKEAGQSRSKMQFNNFLEFARKSGVEVSQEGSRTIWQGPVAGRRKPRGPLSGKLIGIPVASEFSDFQAYYLALYITEFGGTVEFLGADWITWKNVRPTVAAIGVQGMWGMSLNPIPVLENSRQGYRCLKEAQAEHYDALVFPGGHSADILMNDDRLLSFTEAVSKRDVVLASIGAGSLPLIALGILDGRRATGDVIVGYLIDKVGKLRQEAVVRDGSLLTARDTADTPALVRELCRAFDPGFQEPRAGVLKGRRVVIVAGEDFEDVEVVVPAMEFLYRGADLTLATYPPPLRSRPPLLGLDVVSGSFGVSVPLQEIPPSRYTVEKLDRILIERTDLVMIPGAFNPWNMIVAGTPLDFLKEVDKAEKIIAPICHGPVPLSAADMVRGKLLAGTGACRKHVELMGGRYNGSCSAVIDGRIVSGREPSDIPEFLDALTGALLPEDPAV
jgi:protease I